MVEVSLRMHLPDSKRTKLKNAAIRYQSRSHPRNNLMHCLHQAVISSCNTIAHFRKTFYPWGRGEGLVKWCLRFLSPSDRAELNTNERSGTKQYQSSTNMEQNRQFFQNNIPFPSFFRPPFRDGIASSLSWRLVVTTLSSNVSGS
jgi:hypothetical protein